MLHRGLKMKWLFMVALTVVGCRTQALFDCADTVKKELPSPDGKYVALIIDRDCGATTSVSTRVVIRESAKSLELSDAPPVLVVKESSEISLNWDSPGTLAIDLPEGAGTYTKLETWQSIHIAYH